MTKHDHDTCAHKQIKFCGRCDEVYCEDCDAQWTKPCTQNHYPYYWTYQPASGSPYMTGPYYGTSMTGPYYGTSISGVTLDTTSGSDFDSSHGHNHASVS